VQDVPACVTVNVCPATVSVPVRELVPVFAAALKVTDPLPVPLAPAVTVSQVAVLVAVQVQPAAAVTAVDPDPPEVGTVALVGEIDVVHDNPAWLTMNVWPATVIVPVRPEVPVFGWTL